jgi:glycine/D-amino acid oxidase-like deaminating enzyme
MSENRKETVVIIGGGIIGLTTAYELSKKFDVH